MTLISEHHNFFVGPIRKLIVEFYSKLDKMQVGDMDIPNLVEFVKTNMLTEKKFLKLLEPNEYMSTIFDFMTQEIAISYGDLFNFYREMNINRDHIGETFLYKKFGGSLVLLKYLGLVQHKEFDTGKSSFLKVFYPTFLGDMIIKDKMKPFAASERKIRARRKEKMKYTYGKKPGEEETTKPTSKTVNNNCKHCNKEIAHTETYCKDHVHLAEIERLKSKQ